MKIKAVIVDEVPEVCVHCQILRDGLCLLTMENVNDICTYRRGRRCPLMTATQYGEQVWDAVIEKWDSLLVGEK